ncbi:MAG: VOC family protein [Dehalococcoidia bacterium]
MVQNPPEGYPRVVPYLLYEDAGAALNWLTKAFGFEELERIEGPDGVSHAEMAVGDSRIMLGSPGPGYRNPDHLGGTTQNLYIYVDNVDEHCARAKAAGATIIEDVAVQDYGDRRYGARDPEGHCWWFAQPIHDRPRDR